MLRRPVPLVPPINSGINNRYFNSWLNVLIQMFANLPFNNFMFLSRILTVSRELDGLDPNLKTLPDVIKFDNIIKKLRIILRNLQISADPIFNITQKDYDTFKNNLLGDKDFQDFDDLFKIFFELIDSVYTLSALGSLLDFKNYFTINNNETLIECITNRLDNRASPVYILNFIKMPLVIPPPIVPPPPPPLTLTESVITIQNLLIETQYEIPNIGTSLIPAVHFCKSQNHYNVNNTNKYLLLSFSNYKDKCIYINPILTINVVGGGDRSYFINGAICYTGIYYYYIRFDQYGIPQYEYNNNIRKPIIDINRIYRQITIAIYYFYNRALAPAVYPMYQNIMRIDYRLLEYSITYLDDILRHGPPIIPNLLQQRNINYQALIAALAIPPNSYEMLRYYGQSIKLSQDYIIDPYLGPTLENTELYDYFFTNLSGSDIGKTIVNSVTDKEIYDLFYMEENMKQKYNKSIESNTEQFNDTFSSNTKSTDKEVDIENTYNIREQLFSTKKESPTQKYSMFYYNTDEL